MTEQALQQPTGRTGLPGMLHALWLYRRFVASMVRREFVSRYLGSLLGGIWALITPLVTILIYLVIFSAVMRGKLPGGSEDSLGYGIFLCTGILVWTYFAEVVSRCQGTFVENANLLKKMSFPRITLPIIALLNATVNFVLVAVLFVILLVVVGRFPGPAMLGFLPLLALHLALALGLGILLGTLHVFFRDVGQIWAVLVNLWFWVTPIVYHPDILPEGTRWILDWNPLTPLFRAYQRIVLESAWPEWSTLAAPAVLAAVLLVLGLFAFRRLSGEMVDEL